MVPAGGQPPRCNDDTNGSSCARRQLLPASSVCSHVLKLVCVYKNICREFNRKQKSLLWPHCSQALYHRVRQAREQEHRLHEWTARRATRSMWSKRSFLVLSPSPSSLQDLIPTSDFTDVRYMERGFPLKTKVCMSSPSGKSIFQMFRSDWWKALRPILYHYTWSEVHPFQEFCSFHLCNTFSGRKTPPAKHFINCCFFFLLQPYKLQDFNKCLKVNHCLQEDGKKAEIPSISYMKRNPQSSFLYANTKNSSPNS